MKKLVFILVLASCIQIAFSRYTGNVHDFIGRQALAYYSAYTHDVTFNDQNQAYQDFLQGLVDEDSYDIVYGYGSGTEVQIDNIQALLTILSWLGSLGFEVLDVQNYMTTITHFWNSDQSNLESQSVGHADFVQGRNSFSIDPVPTAWAKAKKIVFGDGTPFKHYFEFGYSEFGLDFDLVDGSGTIISFPYMVQVDCIYRYKIYSMDDLLINHNIMIDTGTDGYKYVHLTDDQFSNYIYDTAYNPEYLLLGRLCHLLMDITVPTHAHNDAHVPTFSWTGIWPDGMMAYDLDNYEGWGNIFSISPGGYLSNNTYDLDGVWEWGNVVASYGLELIEMPSYYTSNSYLFDLFYTVNQISQFFASEDVPGNTDLGGQNTTQYQYLNSTINRLIGLTQSDPDYYDLTQTSGVDQGLNEGNQLRRFNKMRDELIPLAIRGTASLVAWWNLRYGHIDVPDYNITIEYSISNYSEYVGLIENHTVTIRDHHNHNIVYGLFSADDITHNGNGNYTIDTQISLPTGLLVIDLIIECQGFHPIINYILQIYCRPYQEVVIENLGPYLLEPITSLGLRVNRSDTFNSFANIMDAINYALDHNIERITLEPGNYYELIDIESPLQQDSLTQNLQIFGWLSDGSSILNNPDPSYNTPIIRVHKGYNGSNLGKLTFKNLVVDLHPYYSGGRGFLFTPDCADSVFIENCEIKNFSCGHPGYIINEPDGIAINSYVNTVIDGCKIHDNIPYDVSDNIIYSGIITLSENSIISNCDIYTNKSGAGIINVVNEYNYPDITIVGNNISSNMTLLPYGEGIGVSCYNAKNITIENNLFTNNGALPNSSTSGSVIYLDNDVYTLDGGLIDSTIKVKNNTFINNTGVNTVNLSALHSKFGYIHDLTNNIFSEYNTAIVLENVQDINNVSINNNLFNDNTDNFEGIDYDQQVNPGNCLFEDPLLNNNDFVPIWNANFISPCIDAGFGEDPNDHTPADIGAKRTVNHKFWEYSFTTQADLEKWYWVSYPVLNSVTNDALVASEFFKELLIRYKDNYDIWQPTYLEVIDWVVQGNHNNIIWNINSHDWTANQSTHFVSSPQGYKVKLLSRAPSIVTLKETGFRTPSDTLFPIYGGEVENWLGYFREGPAWPHEAFASIWDDITMIKTKDWCLVRSKSVEDYWGMYGKVHPLETGDMVIVTTLNDHLNFQWINTDVILPENKALPEYFVFNEKQDYVPVYVSIPDSLMTDLKEIGLYLDGVCKGAVVVEDNFEQICAYLDIDENLTDGVVEFVFYYNNGKSEQQEKKTVLLDPGRLCAQYANGNHRYPYFDISLTAQDIDNIVPPEFTLGQNYPNPFNPTTTISYQLPEAGQVRLDIYNVRGQLVRTLIDAEMKAGSYSIVWNGKDKTGQNMASGIYFYRLSSQSGTLVRKMFLLK